MNTVVSVHGFPGAMSLLWWVLAQRLGKVVAGVASRKNVDLWLGCFYDGCWRSTSSEVWVSSRCIVLRRAILQDYVAQYLHEE